MRRDCAVIFACLIMVIAYISSQNMITPEPEYFFAGSSSKDVPVYLIGLPLEDEENEEAGTENTGESPAEAVEIGRIVRGSSVKKLLGTKEVDGVRYCRVDSTGLEETADLYMKEENLVLSADKVVQETEVYVRTPATIYEDKTGPAIASFAPK